MKAAAPRRRTGRQIRMHRDDPPLTASAALRRVEDFARRERVRSARERIELARQSMIRARIQRRARSVGVMPGEPGGSHHRSPAAVRGRRNRVKPARRRGKGGVPNVSSGAEIKSRIRRRARQVRSGG